MSKLVYPRDTNEYLIDACGSGITMEKAPCNYIGFSTTPHDSAIAIVDSKGEILFAEATERPLQSKRAVNIAPDVLYHTRRVIREFCDPGDDLIAAFSWSEQRGARHRSLLTSIHESEVVLKEFYGRIPEYVNEQLFNSRYLVQSNLAMDFLSGEALELELAHLSAWNGERVTRRRYDHHLTHAAAACFSSPFEEAVCAIFDGYGENDSIAFFKYEGGKLSSLSDRVGIPDRQSGNAGPSLGQFYEDICNVCGFNSASGEEWKVMGLAAYGERDESLRKLFRRMLKINGLHLEPLTASEKWSYWREMHRMRRNKDAPPLSAANIAYTAQEVFAETLYELLTNLYEKCGSKNLVVGGGCALNSSANGGILKNTPFRDLYVFCAPADDGNAVGAALLAWQADHPITRIQPHFQSPYLGSEMSAKTLQNVKEFGRISKLVECSGDAPERAAELLSQGKIIGWIQGRAEFGPRALGNRSILADPRSTLMKDQINSRVKFREEFRPFAPAILDEYGSRYFENYSRSPYMERTLSFRGEVKDQVPAVVHEDGTGRLQTVTREWNERFYRLVRRFYELTDVPIVLNTSFNVMGKPISHSVEDVLAVFFTSGLDAVFINDVWIEK